MTQKHSFEEVNKVLGRHGQGNILGFWGQLDATQKEGLLEQIGHLNLDEIDCWLEKYMKLEGFFSIPEHFDPAWSYHRTPSTPEQQEKYQQALDLGKKLVSEGKVAAFVVAGGQGTRLGHDGPKGNFPISPVKNKTLFQIFAEYLIAASKKYGAACPWYIMTSPLNHEETKELFSLNNYYGLDEKDVFFFPQGTNPNFSFDGKILLADKDRISTSPDGHGGSLRALFESRAIADMKSRGIEYVSYFQVDNPLINILDPLFIGLHALDGAEMSSKALIKAGPLEKVGNFCHADGKVTVIEYSDLPNEMAHKQNPDGSLVFDLGSIAIHIINRSFVEKLNNKGFSLPLHKAVKNISYIDESGKKIDPTEPNGIKLESFVFDALPLASNSIILETVRSEEFAPTKNASGVDSPEVARQMISDRSVNWLESAGVDIPKKSDGSANCVIEIAASFAIYKEDVKQKLDQVPKINPGDKVYLE